MRVDLYKHSTRKMNTGVILLKSDLSYSEELLLVLPSEEMKREDKDMRLGDEEVMVGHKEAQLGISRCSLCVLSPWPPGSSPWQEVCPYLVTSP